MPPVEKVPCEQTLATADVVPTIPRPWPTCQRRRFDRLTIAADIRTEEKRLVPFLVSKSIVIELHSYAVHRFTVAADHSEHVARRCPRAHRRLQSARHA